MFEVDLKIHHSKSKRGVGFLVGLVALLLFAAGIALLSGAANVMLSTFQQYREYEDYRSKVAGDCTGGNPLFGRI